MTKDELDHLVRLTSDAEKLLDFRLGYLQDGLTDFDTNAFFEGRRKLLEVEARLQHEQLKLSRQKTNDL